MFRIMVVEVCDAKIMVYLTLEAKERAHGICTICGEGPECIFCCTSSNNTTCLFVYLTLEANGRADGTCTMCWEGPDCSFCCT